MRRLTAADAMFLYNELPSQHMHTLKLAIFDYANAPGGYSFEAQKQKLAARLGRLPPLRWREMDEAVQSLATQSLTDHVQQHRDALARCRG